MGQHLSSSVRGRPFTSGSLARPAGANILRIPANLRVCGRSAKIDVTRRPSAAMTFASCFALPPASTVRCTRHLILLLRRLRLRGVPHMAYRPMQRPVPASFRFFLFVFPRVLALSAPLNPSPPGDVGADGRCVPRGAGGGEHGGGSLAGRRRSRRSKKTAEKRQNRTDAQTRRALLLLNSH